MGLGHSLMEELILDERGRVRNLGALDYRFPTTMNMPRELHSILIENEDGPGPYGAKGAGEGGILGHSGRGRRGRPAGHRRADSRAAAHAGARLASHARETRRLASDRRAAAARRILRRRVKVEGRRERQKARRSSRAPCPCAPGSRVRWRTHSAARRSARSGAIRTSDPRSSGPSRTDPGVTSRQTA